MACQGGFSASPVRLSFHEKISRGRSIFCCPFAQSAPRWFRNRKIRISKTLTARKRLFSSWCPGGINISQPKLFSCWGSITALSQKNKNALPGQAPPEKASECVLRRQLCQRWARSYAYPGSIPSPPAEGSNIAQGSGGVSRALATPLLEGTQAPEKISTTNPWLRLPIPRGGTGLPWRVTGG